MRPFPTLAHHLARPGLARLSPIHFILLCAVLGGACGGPTSTSSQPRPGPSQSSTKTDASVVAPVAKVVPPGSVSRTEVDAVLKEGPQAFISRLRVRATFRGGRFFGWKLLSYRGPGPLLRGDIVCSINHLPIERPDEFMKVWADLASARELTVDLYRKGAPLTLRYPIAD